MKCSCIRRYYLDHQENTLSVSDRGAFDAHLRECPRCYDDFQAYEATCRMLQAVPRREAPYGFRERVLAALQEGAPEAASPSVRFFAGLRPAWGWAAASVAAASLLMGVLVLRPGAPQPSGEAPLLKADGQAAAVPAAVLPAPAVSAQPVSMLAEVVSPAQPKTAPSLTVTRGEDLQKNLKDIHALVNDINQLAERVYQQPEFLGGDEENELVFDPYRIYQRQTAPVEAAAASYEQ